MANPYNVDIRGGTKTYAKNSDPYNAWGADNATTFKPAVQKVDKATEQQKQQQAKQQVQQKQQAQQKANNSLLGRAKAAGKSLVQGAQTTLDKSVNTVAAGAEGAAGLTKAIAQKATGNDKGAARTVATTSRVINDKLTKGAGDKGAYLTPQQAQKGGTSLIKPGAQAVTDIVPYVLPIGKVAKGASLLEKAGTGALQNAALSGATTTANEAIQGRLTKDKGGEIAKSVATGAILGGIMPLLHGAIKEGAGAVSTKDAKAALTTAKQNSLLDKARASTPPEPRAALNRNTGNALDTVMANVHTPKATLEAHAADTAASNAAAKATQDSAKATEKATADTKKIDQQLELLAAKAKDAKGGKLSNVDQVKVKQLKAQKAELAQTVPTATHSTTAFGKDIPMTEENGYKATPTKDGGVVYQKTAMRGNNAKGDRQAITHYYTSDGKNITQAQHDSMVATDTAADVKPPQQSPATAEAPQPQAPTVASEKPVSASSGNSTPKEATVITPTRTKVSVDPNAPPERGTSKVARDIQTKAVAKGLKNTFGDAAGYDKINIENMAKEATKITNDPERLNRIIDGTEKLPNDVRATALITAVENHPVLSKDPELINRLSQAEHLTGESSRSAQELRLAAERNPHSPIEAIKQVREARSKAVERKTGMTVAKAVSTETKAAKAEIPRLKVKQWHDLVDSLRC